jgi:predicted phage terminase large subunit-like protein
LIAGDYSAAVFVGRRGEEFWVDAVLERLPPELFLARVLDLVQTHGAQSVLLELSLFDSLICGELDRQMSERGLHGLETMTVRNSTRKQLRLCRLGPLLQQQRLHVRPSAGARLLVNQMQEFPQGRHDDGPDALEMGLRMTYPPEHLPAWLSETV